MKPLSQSDPRWASKKLGTGTIRDRGCTVTCLAMLAGTTPDRIVDEANFTTSGAILWASLKSLQFIWRGYSYNNDAVLDAIRKYKGCLVEVNMPQAPGGKHWVLYIGGGRMNDPLTGKTESTSKYVPTGYCVLKPLQTTNPDMSDTHTIPKKTFEELVGKSSQRDKVVNHFNLDIGHAEENLLRDRLKEIIDTKKERIDSLEKTIIAEKEDRLEAETDFKTEIEQLNTSIKQLKEDKKELINELESLKGQNGTPTEPLPTDPPPPQVGEGFTWQEIFKIIKNKLKELYAKLNNAK